MLLIFAAALVIPCDRLPTWDQQTRCALAVQQFVCWTKESDHIDDNDPALLLFWDEGERIEDTKVDLAIERVNGCD
jgi:hypothetical protein